MPFSCCENTDWSLDTNVSTYTVSPKKSDIISKAINLETTKYSSTKFNLEFGIEIWNLVPARWAKGFKGVGVHVGHARPSAALLLAWWRRRLTVKPPLQRSPLTHNNADLRFLCCSPGGSRSPTRAGSPPVFPPCPPWWCGGRGGPDVLAVVAQYISRLCLLLTHSASFLEFKDCGGEIEPHSLAHNVPLMGKGLMPGNLQPLYIPFPFIFHETQSPSDKTKRLSD